MSDKPRQSAAEAIAAWKAKQAEVQAILEELYRVTGQNTEDAARKVSTPRGNRWSRLLGEVTIPYTAGLEHWAMTGPKAGHEAAVVRAKLDKAQHELSKMEGQGLNKFKTSQDYGAYMKAVREERTRIAAAAAKTAETGVTASPSEFDASGKQIPTAAPSDDQLLRLATGSLTGDPGTTTYNLYQTGKPSGTGDPGQPEPAIEVGTGAGWFKGFGAVQTGTGRYQGSQFYPAKKVATLNDALSWVNSLSRPQRATLGDNLFKAGLMNVDSRYDYSKPWSTQSAVLPTTLAEALMKLMLETYTDPGKTIEDKAMERIADYAPLMAAQQKRQAAVEQTNTALLLSMAQQQAHATLFRDLNPTDAQRYVADIVAKERAAGQKMDPNEIQAEFEARMKAENGQEIGDKAMTSLTRRVTDFIVSGG